MKIIKGLENIGDRLKQVSLTIGNFDGVHVGHQRLIGQAVELAGRDQIQSVAITFDKHPLTVLEPAGAPEAIMPLSRRIEIIEQLGVDFLIVLPCDRRILDMSAERFTKQVIADMLAARYVVEGPSFRFGKGRTGDIDYLQTVAGQFDFQAVKVQQVILDLPEYGPVPVSSSLVRQLIYQGKMELVRQCLGRCFELAGVVRPGKARGMRLGFPTANIAFADQILPARGVYAAWAYVREDDRRYPSAGYVGAAATFDDGDVQVEAFLLDFEGNLYDKHIRLELVRHVRGQRRFTDGRQLAKQIALDCRQVRSVLENSSKQRIIKQQ